MIAFLIEHQFWATVALCWIFSAAVSALPDPRPNDGPFYLWFYRFLHSVAGNISTAFGNKLSGLKTALPIVLIVILLSVSACAATRYAVHPGALNPADSVSYDTLLVAATVIDNARADYQAGRLPDSTRPLFNTLVRSYTAARASWLTYRGAIATNVPAADYLNQFNRNLMDLSNAIRAFAQQEGQ